MSSLKKNVATLLCKDTTPYMLAIYCNGAGIDKCVLFSRVVNFLKINYYNNT
jgi:hypothetical protein